LDAAVARQDAPTATRAAHSIKGSSSNFGARRLTELAHDIELKGKGADLAAIAAAAPALREEFAMVAVALTPFATRSGSA
jgi:HPt (histidine-containing phosphotransfer) domain-containing protein